MMDPAGIKARLAEYADGELDPELRAEIEAYLRQDAESRAEVERWQALRAGVRGVLSRETVPTDLAARVRARLAEAASKPADSAPRIRARRWYRLGLPGMAMAAVILLALVMRPTGAQATTVRAADFANVYRRCAVAHHHDTLEVRAGVTWEEFHKSKQCGCAASLAKRAAFACSVPDLAADRSYLLEGACECSPSKEFRVVHAYFRCASGPRNVVSVFATDRRIELCADTGKPGRQCTCGCRHYHAAKSDNVTLICWEHDARSYVMCCGLLTEPQLIELADGLGLAFEQQLGAMLTPPLAQVSIP